MAAGETSGIPMKREGAPEDLSALILQLLDPSTREAALVDLSKRREEFPDLAHALWYSPATIACLVAEIISIYPALSPTLLTVNASNRVCNALALLQVVASHKETKDAFLKGVWGLEWGRVWRKVPGGSEQARANHPTPPSLLPARAAHIPLYLYPFLNTMARTKPFEYLRLTSLGVIGALVKQDDPDVVGFLLKTEIIPLCLRIMEAGSELSRTVATFIVQKILMDDTGLAYVCATPERFLAVANVLQAVCNSLAEEKSIRLLKHVVRCYLRLADNSQYVLFRSRWGGCACVSVACE